MKHSDDELRQAVGLFRYGLIADLAHLPPGTPGIGERLREKANHAYTIPGTRRTRVAAETIRDWLALYRGGGFEALYPKARVDRGRPRRLPPDIAELLVGLKTEQPSLSVNALIGAARERGVERPLAPSTVHRLLSREGLLDKRPGEPVAIDRRRFAFRYAGELWMSDVMHGPKVSDGRRRRKTFLMAFIDDATRVLPFAAFDFSESTTAFLPVLTTGNVLDMYKSIAWELGLPTERSRATASDSAQAQLGVEVVASAPPDSPPSPAMLTGPSPEDVESSLGLGRGARRMVQAGLSSLGYEPGPADGLFGARTRDAIRRYQGEKGFEATGYLRGEETEALVALGEEAALAQAKAERREVQRRADEALLRRKEAPRSVGSNGETIFRVKGERACGGDVWTFNRRCRLL